MDQQGRLDYRAPLVFRDRKVSENLIKLAFERLTVDWEATLDKGLSSSFRQVRKLT